MPMSYPDLESLKRLGKMMKIEYMDEGEDPYRAKLAKIMREKDPVWAHEILVVEKVGTNGIITIK